jgi:hypothetical protein
MLYATTSLIFLGAANALHVLLPAAQRLPEIASLRVPLRFGDDGRRNDKCNQRQL